MEDSEDSLRTAAKLLSVLLMLLSLIFGCALSLVKTNLKLGVSVSLCNRKHLVDMMTLIGLLAFPLDTIQTMGSQQEH